MRFIRLFQSLWPEKCHSTLQTLSFVLLPYLFLVLYIRSQSSRDPGSFFFRTSSAYDLSYSAVRLEQADAYIKAAETSDTKFNDLKASKNPEFCLGIATIARSGVRYFKSTVGTVLEGLSDSERANIHLIFFIAHTDPSQHPAYAEPWLHKLADQVLLYNSSDVDIDHIKSLETDEAKLAGREKALFDYSYLLQACEAVGAPYTIILEDDVVAQDGWYHRTRDALVSVETQMQEIGAPKWLYLRLFYTEEFFGWNAEEWPIYLFYSILIVCFVGCSLLGIRQYRPSIRPHLPNKIIAIVSVVGSFLLIGLFFAAGRVTMMPIPEGVHQMPKFGCCSQALVFPHSRLNDLVDLFTSKRIGYVDMLTEEFANANQEIRWALTPSVMQHVGRKSSKGDQAAIVQSKPKSKAELSNVEMLWNFRFELNVADALHLEHMRDVREHE
ncbi:hypothetical protein N7466_009761 [Penicillium verhagenii]|uniref:uncharacterized protein n=1 Tax=Penicillium verhagenii TaxID=1562060 RepID=UPI0025454E62|nr:uncharacterized protein N7466_009761 [Penicillium verhagenii]KAJ5921435.1 hypothetical protein N7466_009761 [Penicillium verhagenii]